MHRPDVDIISKYNAEIRGLYNYYKLAGNVSVLSNFYFMMKGSMVKTLAAKYNTTSKKIRDKYTIDGVFGAYYHTKDGLKRCEFYHDGFRVQDESAKYERLDTLPQYRKYDKPNSLAARLRQGACELCGVATSEIHMHHIRRLKDLKGRNEFEVLMMSKRRKSLALCPQCYERSKKLPQPKF